MDIFLIIICATVVIGFLVLIHEGGHYIAARAFGVRVTEFMLGLPGPSLSFKKGETRFGVTTIPLGGYAKVCGMEAGELSPYLERVLTKVYTSGKASAEDIAQTLMISEDDAQDALEQLCEWGSVVRPHRKDELQLYCAPEFKPSKRTVRQAEAEGKPCPQSYELGQPRTVDNPHALFESEYKQQYRALPFWKRSVILLAGIGVNLLFAVLAFIVIFSIFGIDYQYKNTGEVTHIILTPLQSIQYGFMYIGMVVQAVLSLFNPQTAAQTVSDSTSIIGIAIMSKDFFMAGIISALQFMAMISVSLGIMNLLPIVPLDGGRFVVEIIQKLTRHTVSTQAMGYMSMAGMVLFIGFALFMMNQDIQRFVFNN